MLLTDDEILEIKYSAADKLEPVFRAIAKAQLKKVADWLQTEVLEDCHDGYSNVQCFHRRALQDLLKEVT